MFDSFYLHKFVFRITPAAATGMPGWVGAVLRNNFMYAAENIAAGNNISLRNVIDSVDVPTDHPLFRELNGTPPKCIYIAPVAGTVTLLERQNGVLHADQWLEFSVTIFGRFEVYASAVLDAVDYMCKRGFGYPMVSFTITDVLSCHSDGALVPYSGQNHKAVRMTDFQGMGLSEHRRHLVLSLDSPTDVINVNNPLGDGGLSYRDITSGFPSFYLIAKTSLNRIEKLNTIYCDPDSLSHFAQEHEMMLDFLRSGCDNIILTSADIFRMQTKSTPKKGRSDVIPLGGYVGRLAFMGGYVPFLPYLTMAQHIGIGRNVAYGSGSFRIVSM